MQSRCNCWFHSWSVPQILKCHSQRLSARLIISAGRPIFGRPNSQIFLLLPTVCRQHFPGLLAGHYMQISSLNKDRNTEQLEHTISTVSHITLEYNLRVWPKNTINSKTSACVVGTWKLILCNWHLEYRQVTILSPSALMILVTQKLLPVVVVIF